LNCGNIVANNYIHNIPDSSRIESLITKGESMRPIEEKLIYLESRLDDVENELNMLTHKKYELEERRKTLLEKINKLNERREDTVHQQLFGI